MSSRGSDSDSASTALASLWNELLPEGVVCSAGFVGPWTETTAAESAALGAVGTLRARQFAAGRSHAKAALAKLGIACADLLRAPSGAPAWPPGVVGSIAHAELDGRVHAVAVAARSGEFASIGVDLEAQRVLHAKDWHALLTPAELRATQALAVDQRARAVMQRWCAKEAAAKALSQERTDLRQLVVRGVPDDHAFGQFGGRFAVAGRGMAGAFATLGSWTGAFCAEWSKYDHQL